MHGERRGQDSNRTRGFTKKVQSEEHTSELQSQSNIVCRLLLEKKTCSLRHQRSTELIFQDARTDLNDIAVVVRRARRERLAGESLLCVPDAVLRVLVGRIRKGA